jgi:hypothetical protein
MDALMALYDSCCMWCRWLNRSGHPAGYSRRSLYRYQAPANSSVLSMFWPR